MILNFYTEPGTKMEIVKRYEGLGVKSGFF
jgi:hypothetical protein